MNFHRRRNFSDCSAINNRKLLKPSVEVLEFRILMASSPFGPQFQQQFQSLLEQYNFPQGSIAVIQNGQTFTYGATNTDYPFSGPAPSAQSSDSLFRVASLTKTLTAMAILKLVQDGQINLNDSALADLGYTPGETISGRNPLNGDAVNAQVDPQLLQITIKELLQMTSGLEYNIPLASEAFPSAGAGDVTTNVEGSYASLGFAPAPGGGSYTAPASMQQMVNYMVYEVSANPSLIVTAPGSSYYYNNINYGILSLIVATKSGSNGSDPATEYWNYVDSQILEPLGISPVGVVRPRRQWWVWEVPSRQMRMLLRSSIIRRPRLFPASSPIQRTHYRATSPSRRAATSHLPMGARPHSSRSLEWADWWPRQPRWRSSSIT